MQQSDYQSQADALQIDGESWGSGQSGSQPEAMTVSAAMGLAKGALENITVHIMGEVSEVSNKPGYKAVYFTVKDEKASLPCMMWNNRYQAAGVELQIGALVELSGRFTVYAAKGRMNFDVFSVKLAGEGVLRMQVANLARKLQAEGLMLAERKRELPHYPETIGLLTSPRGAAVHDVLRTLRRRYPLARVLLAGVPVEGTGAPAALIEGLNCVISAGAEVVLVVRGGGSFEDLMPFNDEALARAIADAPVPIVTGIGHEPDTSIADMVADVRASTPTAAAEAVAPDEVSLNARIESCAAALTHALSKRIASDRTNLERIMMLPLFREPSRLFENDSQTLDELCTRLHNAIPQSLENNRKKIDLMRTSLMTSLPHVLSRYADRTAALKDRMYYQGESLPQRFVRDMSVAAARLQNLSPLAVLARGYAIARDETDSIVKSVNDVHCGDSLTVSVADGAIGCTVNNTKNTETPNEFLEES